MSEIKVIQLSPASGRPGSVVSIEGTGFASGPNDNVVEFDGTAATVTDASATELTVDVPAQATSGPVTVDTSAGSATSPQSFQIVSPAAPTISGISPNVVGKGGTTTITGTNFDTSKPANSVAVNRTRAGVTSATATALDVKVPAATGSGPVSVTTVDGTATGPYLFIPPYAYTPSDIAVTGTITRGESTTRTISSPEKIALLVFEGQAGDRVGLKATGSGMAGSADVLKPDGSHLSGVGYSNGSQQFMDTATLPVDGTYTVVIDPSGTQTGSVTLNLFDVPQDVTEVFQPTSAGDSKTMAPTVSGQNLRATFQGTAGERIFVKVANGDADRSKLLNPNGAVLNDAPLWAFSMTYYIDTMTLPADGTYTVLVDPRGAALSSSTITIYSVPADVERNFTPTVTGHAETMNLAVGQRAKLQFEGSEGQQISVKSGSSVSGPLILSKPDGTQLAPSNIASGHFLEPVTLPADGTYTLTADPGDVKSGSVTITTFDFPGDVTEEFDPTPGGDTSTLTPISAGQNLRATFEGNTGDRVFVKVSNGAADRSKLLRPDGSALVDYTTWVSNSQTYYMDSQVLPADGTYTVLVNPHGAEIAASTITIYAVPADDVRDIAPAIGGSAQTFNLAVGQAGKLRFEGVQGQRISVKGSNASLSGPMTLRKPDGSQLASGTVNSWSFLEPVALPASGTYTLTVDPSNIQSGSVTLTTYDVPPDLTEVLEPTAGGDTATLTPQSAGQNLRATFQGTANQRVFVKMSNGGAWRGKVLHPNGSALASFPTWLSNSQTYYFDMVTLPSNGTYTVLVDPEQADMTGTAVTVYDIPSDVTGTLTATVGGDSAPISLSVGQQAALSFSGTTGQKIQVQSSSSTFAGSLVVKRPSGTTLTSTSIAPNDVRATSVQTLPDNGTYSIKADAVNVQSGNVTVTLFDRTGVATPLDDFPTMFALGTGRSAVVPAVEHSLASPSPAHSGKPQEEHAVRRAREARLDRRAARRERHDHGERTSPRSARASEQPKAHAKQATVARRAAKRHLRVDPATRGFRPTQGPSWRPGGVDRLGGWMTNSPDTPWSELASREAPPGETALAGQVLKVNGVPLRGVRVSFDGEGRVAVTDASGRFLLRRGVPGKGVLVVDANRVAGTRARFGTYSFQVELESDQTTELEQPVWLTALDPKGDVEIPVRTKRRMVLTNPKIPGFEVRIPAGSEIRDRQGRPVRKLNLSAVPLDRTPFPLPHFDVPAYFTLQPGGAYLSKGARVIYPNYMQAAPTQPVQFWNYDADDKGWHVYGYGRVSDDAKRMEPDPGVRIWEFTGAMIGNGTGPPSAGPSATGGPTAGDPVDLSTGLFVEKRTDLLVPDVIPATVERTYRPGDNNLYAFGRGTTSLYDTRVWSPTESLEEEPQLIQPDGSVVHYQRVNPEVRYWDAVYEPVGATGRFAGSVLARNANFGFDLRFRDGTVYVFGNYSPLLAIRDAAGNELRIDRGGAERGLVQQVTTPNGRWLRFEYNSQNLVSRAVDNAGRETSYTYTNDVQRRLVTVTDANGGVSSRTYDGAGQLTTLTDARGITYLENIYDANGRVTRQELADDGMYEFDYDLWPSGRVQRAHVTNPRGAVRTVTFDQSQQAVSDVTAVGETIEQGIAIERNSNTSQIVSVTDELDRVTEFDYDSRGNVIAVTELAGTSDARTTTATYDTTLNRLTSLTDPLEHTTTYDHDARGRLTSLVDATNREYTLSYEGSDVRPATVTDPADKTYEVDYANGDLAAVRNPLGHETRFYTDAAGRRTRMIDPLGNTTSYRYDDGGLLRRSVAPSGATTEFDYDANGNLTEVTDARSNAITATYDNMDRISSFTDASSNSAAFIHDDNGNLTKVTDRTGRVATFRYDLLDRVTFAGFDTTGTPGNEQYESTIAYTYDDANRLVEALDSTAGTFTHAFNGIDQVTSESGPNGTVTYAYDDAARMTSVGVAGQPALDYAYDAANRLTSVTRGAAAVGIGYDTAGRRASLSLPNGVTQAYSYNDASRLTGINYAQTGLPLGSLQYGYNAAGRRTHTWGSLAGVTLPQPMASATYDASNRRTSQRGATLTYDAAGNLTSDGEATYEWNARHELESVDRGQSLTTFSYDPFGRRLERTADGSTTGYLHARRNVVQEQRGSSIANVIGGPQVDDVFARTNGTEVDSYLTDALGSTIGLSDSLGWAAGTTYEYGPFGETTKDGAPNDNPYQFAGRENDGDGLYYNRARYYQPGNQRFLSEDPLGLAGGDTNFYTYAANDPANRTDPMGLSPSLTDFAHSITGTFDTLTFGTTTRIRNWQGIGYGGIDPCSGMYRGAGGIMRGFMAGEIGFLSGTGAAILGSGWGLGWMGSSIFGGWAGGATESFVAGEGGALGGIWGGLGGAFGGFADGPGGPSAVGDAVGAVTGAAFSLASGAGFGEGEGFGGVGRGKCEQ